VLCSIGQIANGLAARKISFVSASQYILASWQEVTANLRGKQLERYARLLLERIASCKVGHRPGRIEPRIVKRRRDQYTLMTEPRKQLQKRLYKGDNRCSWVAHFTGCFTGWKAGMFRGRLMRSEVVVLLSLIDPMHQALPGCDLHEQPPVEGNSPTTLMFRL
jgi:hypothetical protein